MEEDKAMTLIDPQPKLKDLLLATIKAFDVPEWSFLIERIEAESVESFSLSIVVDNPVLFSLCFSNGPVKNLVAPYPCDRDTIKNVLAIWGIDSSNLEKVEICAEPESAVRWSGSGYVTLPTPTGGHFFVTPSEAKA
jgi:hypothetical protein